MNSNGSVKIFLEDISGQRTQREITITNLDGLKQELGINDNDHSLFINANSNKPLVKIDSKKDLGNVF
jgi:hypothetical protein